MLDQQAVFDSPREFRLPVRREVTRLYVSFVMIAFSSFLSALAAGAQSLESKAVPVIMLSDLHFDPFHDPAKVPLLAKSPVSQWTSILAAPDSPDQAARFAAVQKACKAKAATDTPYPLLRSALDAAGKQSPGAAFVTVSGDLLVHDLDCRYRASTLQTASGEDNQSLSADFAEKTTSYVIHEVEAAFPKIPVYTALGNNDSRCDHNRLDRNDDYLRSSSRAIVAGLRGSSPRERLLARRTYESAGYYAVNMPSPMQNTRLVVVDDVYMMPAFNTCKATEDRQGQQEQLSWLQKELDTAEAKHQRVWLLGHLPPTVNPDASLTGHSAFCSESVTVRFQQTESLTTLITAHAATIKLGIFGHTHMDSFHLLESQSDGVPIKVVAAVSPVDGNLPSFTVGKVDLSSATLADYSVYEASNDTGLGTQWSEEYDFDRTYHEQSFTPSSLSELIARLRTDKEGRSAESRNFQTHFLKGSSPKKLSPSWKGFVCSLDNPTAVSFKACFCGVP